MALTRLGMTRSYRGTIPESLRGHMASKGKRRGGTSVLSRQKPKKARGKRSDWQRRLRVGLIALAVILVAAAGTWFLTRQPATPRDSFQWKVTLKMDGDQPLPTSAAEEILAVVRKNLGQGTNADLRRAARLAQKTDSYATVNLVRTGDETVVVQVKPREALLCIEADKLRLVGVDGAVYGAAISPEVCPGPVLKGVFSEGRSKYTMREDVTLATDEEEQAIIREALDLVRLAAAQKLTITSIDHRRYRGFTIALKDRDLEVAIGRAPFTGKLHKLDEILGKLAEKGEQAMRVELDYQGKAFIKLKKM